MKKLLYFISNPFILSIFPAAILIFIIPFEHQRYNLLLEESATTSPNRIIWYDDLTMNGYSEMIEISDFNHYTTIRVYDHKGATFNQWNFDGNIRFRDINKPYISGDYNNSGKKEIFFFTLSNDSIFLNIIDDIEDPFPRVRNRFIDQAGPGKGKPDPSILPAKMQDLNENGKKELIFGINSGFSRYPRNIYAYYIDNDSLVKSPEAYNTIRSIFQADINNNGKKEVIPLVSSTANVSPDSAKIHDYSNWMMIFDQNMEFLFEPVEIPGKTQVFTPFVFKENGKKTLAGILATFRSGSPSKVYYFDGNGKVDTVKKIPEIKASSALILYNEEKQPKIFLRNPNQGLFIYDHKSNSVNHCPDIYFTGNYLYTDLNNDGRKEIFTTNRTDGKAMVVRKDLKYTATADIDWSGRRESVLLSLIKENHKISNMHLQMGRKTYTFKYKSNPTYYISYSYYFLIYLGVLIFTLTTSKIQKHQLQKKHETEKKITELQLNLVKSQLDPHFTMNLINSIVHSIKHNKTASAFENLKRFSRLNKNMLLSAEAVQRTLKQELEFCEDYLELEKTRLNNKFDYQIKIDPDIDTGQKVPKMIIQGHAENSVKHGIFHRESGGKVSIEVKKNSKGLTLTITDNGVGRVQAAHKGSISTGKGINIMNEYYKLYGKYSKEKIDFNITDLFDENNKPAGTQVIIIINQPNEK